MLIQTEWKDIKGEEKLTSGPNSNVLKVKKKRGGAYFIFYYIFISFLFHWNVHESYFDPLSHPGAPCGSYFEYMSSDFSLCFVSSIIIFGWHSCSNVHFSRHTSRGKKRVYTPSISQTRLDHLVTHDVPDQSAWLVELDGPFDQAWVLWSHLQSQW